MAEAQADNQQGRGKRAIRMGAVVSDRADKTIRVRFDYMVKHKKYGKYIRRSTTLHAHDENNVAKMGDKVELAACRPISKLKNWRLLRVIREA